MHSCWYRGTDNLSTYLHIFTKHRHTEGGVCGWFSSTGASERGCVGLLSFYSFLDFAPLAGPGTACTERAGQRVPMTWEEMDFKKGAEADAGSEVLWANASLLALGFFIAVFGTKMRGW